MEQGRRAALPEEPGAVRGEPQPEVPPDPEPEREEEEELRHDAPSAPSPAPRAAEGPPGVGGTRSLTGSLGASAPTPGDGVVRVFLGSSSSLGWGPPGTSLPFGGASYPRSSTVPPLVPPPPRVEGTLLSPDTGVETEVWVGSGTVGRKVLRRPGPVPPHPSYDAPSPPLFVSWASTGRTGHGPGAGRKCEGPDRFRRTYAGAGVVPVRDRPATSRHPSAVSQDPTPVKVRDPQDLRADQHGSRSYGPGVAGGRVGAKSRGHSRRREASSTYNRGSLSITDLEVSTRVSLCPETTRVLPFLPLLR